MKKREEPEVLRYGRALLAGIALSLLVCTASLFLVSLATAQGVLPPELDERLILGSCVLGALVGGGCAAAAAPGRGPILGGLTGLFLLLTQLSVGVLSGSGLPEVPGRLLACVLGGLCGGVLLGKRSAGKKGKKRRG